jgi:hypothetical protein
MRERTVPQSRGIKALILVVERITGKTVTLIDRRDRATCSVCQKDTVLRQDGKIGIHGEPRCPGGNRPPAEAA